MPLSVGTQEPPQIFPCPARPPQISAYHVAYHTLRRMALDRSGVVHTISECQKAHKTELNALLSDCYGRLRIALDLGRWRREWDSNPRDPYEPTRVPGERLQPLGHPSANCLERAALYRYRHESQPTGKKAAIAAILRRLHSLGTDLERRTQLSEKRVAA